MPSKVLRGKYTGTSLIITEDTLGSNKDITAAFSTFEDTGLSVTITAEEGEYVELKLSCIVESAAGTGTSQAIMNYVIDSDTPVRLVQDYLSESTVLGGDRRDMVHSNRFIGPLTAGSHTIKIEASGSGGNFTILSGATCAFQIIQYR